MEMANTGRSGEAGELTPGKEIALMIAQIAKRHAAEEQTEARQYGEHPADMILNRLGDVDARQKARARSEIDDLAGLVARKADMPASQAPDIETKAKPAPDPENQALESDALPKPVEPPRRSLNPFAPAREPIPQASTWISDVFTAAAAEQKHILRASMSPFATRSVKDVAADVSAQPALMTRPAPDPETPTHETPEAQAETADDASMLDFPDYSRARADEIAARYRQDPVEESEPPEDTIEVEPVPSLPMAARNDYYDMPEAARDTDAEAYVAPAAAARTARPAERPGWMLYGLPAITMVSVIALAFAIETSDSVAVRAVPSNTSPAPVATTPATEATSIETASQTAIIEPVIPIAETSPPETVEPGRTETGTTDPASSEAAPVIPPEITDEAVRAAPVPPPEPDAAAPEPVIVATAPSARVPVATVPSPAAEPAPISLADIHLASAPSLKPNISGSQRFLSAQQPNVSVSSALSSSNEPQNTIPARLFSGPIEAGSAADLVIQAAQTTGPELTKAEQFWLARDVERVLENEIDGRTVSVKSRQGQRVRVFLETSKQVERNYAITRSADMGALPYGLVLDGGWFAAKNDVALNATAALGSEFRLRQLKQDMLIERIGIYTGRHGDRWYLMGQRGVAVGFVSAADVVHAGASTRPLGLPYHQIQGDLIAEERVVYTRCREGFIGPEGGSAVKLSVCRDAAGHWIDADEGLLTKQTAGLFGGVAPSATNAASTIVLAEVSHDPVAYHALANRYFRRRFQGALASARAGQITRQTLPDGSDIQFTFGDTYGTSVQMPIKRVAAMTPLQNGLRVQARWMTAPAGADIHATPDHLVTGGLGDIPPGRAVEAIGMTTGRNGADWTIVGRKGIAFGYVETVRLSPISGSVSPIAISSAHTTLAVDLIKTATVCRTVRYETIDATGDFNACQEIDGTWTVQPEVSSQFADLGAMTSVAP